jgi:hypothetical protein
VIEKGFAEHTLLQMFGFVMGIFVIHWLFGVYD